MIAFNSPPRFIVVHCSDTEDGPGLSWEAIRQYHMSYRHNGRTISEDEARVLMAGGAHVEAPWEDIGYNLGLELYGTSIVIEPGRPLHVQGAHCAAQGRNHDSIGVCIVGTFDDEPPAPAVLDCVVHVLAWLCLLLHVPAERVVGHREMDPEKTCPGARFDMDTLRELVGERIKHGLLFLGWVNT
ncbi:MAG TPA: peptidoglycan recognition family protein [Thermoanaerobaculaceae bacterium]|nr:peptidoglycan recognition family protein [Thermoanaerobaculaceae bacterium]